MGCFIQNCLIVECAVIFISFLLLIAFLPQMILFVVHLLTLEVVCIAPPYTPAQDGIGNHADCILFFRRETFIHVMFPLNSVLNTPISIYALPVLCIICFHGNSSAFWRFGPLASITCKIF